MAAPSDFACWLLTAAAACQPLCAAARPAYLPAPPSIGTEHEKLGYNIEAPHKRIDYEQVCFLFLQAPPWPRVRAAGPGAAARLPKFPITRRRRHLCRRRRHRCRSVSC